jgi:hypothetical protein
MMPPKWRQTRHFPRMILGAGVTATVGYTGTSGVRPFVGHAYRARFYRNPFRNDVFTGFERDELRFIPTGTKNLIAKTRLLLSVLALKRGSPPIAFRETSQVVAGASAGRQVSGLKNQARAESSEGSHLESTGSG